MAHLYHVFVIAVSECNGIGRMIFLISYLMLTALLSALHCSPICPSLLSYLTFTAFQSALHCSHLYLSFSASMLSKNHS